MQRSSGSAAAAGRGGRRAAGQLPPFQPQQIQEYLERNRSSLVGHAFVSVEGLGKIAYSNIRTPKPLMDLSTEAKKGGGAGGEDGAAGAGGGAGAMAASTRSLEQEPMLAARIMMEDCMNLLLDVDDINRLLLAPEAFQHVDAGQLHHSKAVMIDAIIASFRLPAVPVLTAGGAGAGGGGNVGDGVFLRIMALPKGRGVMTHCLHSIFHAGTWDPARYGLDPKLSSPLQIMWAVMRNGLTIFEASALNSEKATDSRMVAATSKLADALGRAIEANVPRVDDLNTVLLAFLAAVQAAWASTGAGVIVDASGQALRMLPLATPATAASSPSDGGGAGGCWLGTVLEALLVRGSQAAGSAPAFAEWRQLTQRLVAVVLAHLRSVKVIRAGAMEGGDKEMATTATRAMCPPLLLAMLPYAADAADRATLQAYLAAANTGGPL